MTLMEKRLFGVHSDVFPLGSFPSGSPFSVLVLTPGCGLLYKCGFLKGGKPYAHVAKGIDSRGSWQCRR
jgi:hypothetical protein